MPFRETYRRLPAGLRVTVVAAGGLILLLVAGMIVVWWAVSSQRRSFTSPDTRGWQTGDIFFSSGNSWKSLCVRALGGESEERISHCGFILIKDGRPMLVHASTDKGHVTMEGVEEYARVNDVSGISAVRLRELPDTVQLRRRLEELLRAGKPFDNSFDLSDTTEYYCTELILRVLERVGSRAFVPLLSSDYVYPQQLVGSSAVRPIR